MVNSSAPPSGRHKRRGTSYADQAKKGQNAKASSSKEAASASISGRPAGKEHFPSMSNSSNPPIVSPSSRRKNEMSYAQASSHTLPRKPTFKQSTPTVAQPNVSTSGSRTQQKEQAVGSNSTSSASGQVRTDHQLDFEGKRASGSDQGQLHNGGAASQGMSRDSEHSANANPSFPMSIHGQDHDRLLSPNVHAAGSGGYMVSGVMSSNPEYPYWSHYSSSSSDGSPLIVQPELAPAHQALTPNTGPGATSQPIPYTQSYSLHPPNGHSQSHDAYPTVTNTHPSQYYSHPSSYASSPGQTPPVMSPLYEYPPAVPVAFPVVMMPVLFQPAQGCWAGQRPQSSSGHSSPAYLTYPPTPPGFVAPTSQVFTSPQGQPYNPARGRTQPSDQNPHSRVNALRPPPPEASQPVMSYSLANEADYDSSMMFGTVNGADERSGCPSPQSFDEYQRQDDAGVIGNQFASLSIGFGLSDGDQPRARSRSWTLSSARSRTATMSEDGVLEVKEERTTGEEVIPKSIDLANPDYFRWEFGTVTTTGDSDEGHPRPASAPPHKIQTPLESENAGPLSRSCSIHLSSSHSVRESPVYRLQGSSHELHTRLEELSTSNALKDRDDLESDVFKVRDFGFGFGPGSRSPTEIIPNNSQPIQQDSSQANVPDVRDGHTRDNFNRPRRGFQGYGRGQHSGRRGRGYGGYNRRNNRRGGGFQNQHRQPPFNNSTGGYQPPYHGNSSQPPPFHPGYNSYSQRATGRASVSSQVAPAAPDGQEHELIPVPVTSVPFPLDTARLCLLGQVEHYLSSHNMAPEPALREKMDSEGWLHISALVNFGRIPQFNADIEFLCDVLNLSSLVELRGYSIRLINWEHTAAQNGYTTLLEDSQGQPSKRLNGDASPLYSEDDDESDDDVEIVINQDLA